jgi:threonine/homoserine/homoserine lactone efflux protein
MVRAIEIVDKLKLGKKMITLEYILAALVVVLVPGAGVIYTLSIALIHGRIQMLYAALGCTLAITPHLLACIFGVAALLNTSVMLFNLLKGLGVLYLLYMAYNLYKDRGILELNGEEREISHFSIIKNGFLLNVLNPKLSIFFLAFIPQFVSISSDSSLIDMSVLGLVFMLITFATFIIYGLFANLVKNKVTESKTIMARIQKSFAVIFTVLAYKLAST